MGGIGAFAGSWEVDTARSDSIEPMLKAMGVAWKIRKIVMLLKVVQLIEVKEGGESEELVMTNVSKHGTDHTTHLVNAGEKLISTSRGDQVIDECSFDSKRSFGLHIKAVLPQGKGSTLDRRQMMLGGDAFLQHLTYKSPDSAQPDILMRRIFIRTKPGAAAELTALANSGSKSKSGSKSESGGGGGGGGGSVPSVPVPPPVSTGAPTPASAMHGSMHGRTSNGGSAHLQTPAAVPKTPSASPSPSPSSRKQRRSRHRDGRRPSQDRGEAGVGSPKPRASKGGATGKGGATDESSTNTPELWAMAVFGAALLTALYFAKASVVDTLPVVALVGGARLLARSQQGRAFVVDEHLRWGAVVVAMAGCTLAYFRFLARPGEGLSRPGESVSRPGESADGLSVAAVAAAALGLAVARVHAGLESTASRASSSPSGVAAALRELSVAQQLAATGILAAAGAAGAVASGPPALVFASLFGSALVGVAVWYQRFVGFDRRADGGQHRQRRRRHSRDREGRSLRVAVVGRRLVKNEQYAQYKVQVWHEGLTWIVWRRFSQFDTLRHELRRMFGHGVLPQLPAKTWFANKGGDFLERRVGELDVFVKALTEESLRAQVFKVAETRKFLGVGTGKGKTPEEMAAAEAAGKEAAGAGLKATTEETQELMQALAEANAIFDKALTVGEGDGWTFLKKHQGVQCYLKQEGDFTHTKGVGTIDAPPLVASAFMADPLRRKYYDDLFKKDSLLRTIDVADASAMLGGAPVDVCDVKLVEFKSPFPLAIAARDTLLITARSILPDGTVKVIMCSAPDSYAPPTSKFVRAKVFAAGMRVEPHPSRAGASLFSTVQMLDPNGSIPGWVIKVVAPERAALSAKVNAAMKKLNDYPAPLPIPSQAKAE